MYEVHQHINPETQTTTTRVVKRSGQVLAGLPDRHLTQSSEPTTTTTTTTTRIPLIILENPKSIITLGSRRRRRRRRRLEGHEKPPNATSPPNNQRAGMGNNTPRWFGSMPTRVRSARGRAKNPRAQDHRLMVKHKGDTRVLNLQFENPPRQPSPWKSIRHLRHARRSGR